jgi:hypothetical protein
MSLARFVGVGALHPAETRTSYALCPWRSLPPWPGTPSPSVGQAPPGRPQLRATPSIVQRGGFRSPALPGPQYTKSPETLVESIGAGPSSSPSAPLGSEDTSPPPSAPWSWPPPSLAVWTLRSTFRPPRVACQLWRGCRGPRWRRRAGPGQPPSSGRPIVGGAAGDADFGGN